MSKFEKVSRYSDIDIPLPVRKTSAAAGYDFAVAEDIIIPSYYQMAKEMEVYNKNQNGCMSLDEMSTFTKKYGFKPTLVSTGMKCKLPSQLYLELSVRSSSPLKYWIIMANGVGIIDSDYYNNEDNEGEIFFQLINLSPFPIQLRKGDIIGQGIIKHYYRTENDISTGVRKGGFGSTSGLVTTHYDDGSTLTTSASTEPTVAYAFKTEEEMEDDYVPFVTGMSVVDMEMLSGAVSGVTDAIYKQ